MLQNIAKHNWGGGGATTNPHGLCDHQFSIITISEDFYSQLSKKIFPRCMLIFFLQCLRMEQQISHKCHLLSLQCDKVQ